MQYCCLNRSHYSPRRFYVNNNWGGCFMDAGWLLVSEGRTFVCSYESHDKLVLLYSPTSTYISYNESTYTIINVNKTVKDFKTETSFSFFFLDDSLMILQESIK